MQTPENGSPRKVTAIVLTYNEEENIRDCMESVKWADEILVADSFSTDGTLEIVRSYGARILQNPYKNHAAQSNWAIPQAAHEWILFVDADERVTDELREEVQHLLVKGPERDGYFIYRRNFVFGKEIKHGGWDRDKTTRFFHRDRCRKENREVHADFKINGEPGYLKGKLLHYTYHNFDQYFEKFGRYTTWAANDLYKNGKKVSLINLFFRPAFGFMKRYILRLGFLDGALGLILAMLSAFATFTKYAKLWLMRLKKNG